MQNLIIKNEKKLVHYENKSIFNKKDSIHFGHLKSNTIKNLF
jgi:hypothetical protein